MHECPDYCKLIHKMLWIMSTSMSNGSLDKGAARYMVVIRKETSTWVDAAHVLGPSMIVGVVDSENVGA
jgi:hypothetical protein